MKTITLIALAVAFSGNVYAGTAANQHNRIAQGVASGSLDKAETHHLVKQQQGIVTAAISGASASTIQKLVTSANITIYKLKHN